MAAEKKSYFWICLWLWVLALLLSGIGSELHAIVKLLQAHAGNP